MVQFMTLEDKVEAEIYQETQKDVIVPNLFQEMQHNENCIKPEITIQYETGSQVKASATYGNEGKKKMAGCTCGAKAEIDINPGQDTALQQPSYSSSMNETEKGTYGKNNNSVAQTYY